MSEVKEDLEKRNYKEFQMLSRGQTKTEKYELVSPTQKSLFLVGEVHGIWW